MVFFAPIIGAATLFAGFASALPRPDSASGPEVAVSAPNGIILSDTPTASSALATASSYPASAASSYAAAVTSSAAAYGSSGYNSGYGSSVNSSYGSSSVDSSYGSSSVDSSYGSSSVDSSYGSNSYGSGYSSSSSAYVATSTASASSSMMTYGSGSTNWGGSGYNDCVNQCIASFGTPPDSWTPPPPTSTSSSGSGVTHTVIVAPSQGVLRYVPFFVNANPGDTVHFVWHANNHTVTKSSQLEMCNKTSDAPFASGTQNEGFTFDQVVNDTTPTYFYCGTPTHCQKGMFGMINPPAGTVTSNSSVGSMMSSMVSNSSDLSAMWSYTNNMTANNSAAASWGSSIDLSSMPTWAHTAVMENVMYGRTFLAANPEVLNANGQIDMTSSGTPIMFPQDITVALNNDVSGSPTTSGSATSSGAPASSSAASSSTSASSAPSATNTNGASSNMISGAFISVAVMAVSFLAL
ncbi:hypothetical protein PHLCEN_2v9469 [Hermanssonia centrifuga]|uniref:Phytocyanin domain-containing protein n=1 Tax=Hermanssonia centrifuga TaxID=98765 RepID=A0A2R6NQS4_9APHY|nr:hypothetical protein PHLCEN_2v9469 [Hermanssonia centrifuga]